MKTSKEYFDSLPAANSVLDDPVKREYFEFTMDEMLRFAEKYAAYVLACKDGPVTIIADQEDTEKVKVMRTAVGRLSTVKMSVNVRPKHNVSIQLADKFTWTYKHGSFIGTVVNNRFFFSIGYSEKEGGPLSFSIHMSNLNIV